MTSSLRQNRDFNLFWAGQTFSALGDAISIIAVPLLVLEATGSLTMMGMVTASVGLGSLVAGIFGGPLVDRVDRRKLMIRMDWGRFALFLMVPLLWPLLNHPMWFVFLVSIISAAMAMLFGIAYITAVPNLVDRGQLTEANGRLGASHAFAFAIGPVIAGFVVEQFGAANAIGLDGATFLISAVTLTMLRLRQASAVRPTDERNDRREELLAGVRFLFGSSIFRWITLVTSVVVFTYAGVNDLIIFQVKENLSEPDRTVGIMYGIASLGSVVSGLTIARLRSRFGFGACYVTGTLIFGAAVLILGVIPTIPVMTVMMTIGTFGEALRGTLTMTLRQELTPDHLLGRVTAAFWTVFTVPGPVGALVLTSLAAHYGVPRILQLVGVMLVLLGVVVTRSPIASRQPGLVK
ncbi:MAG: MFS transporter [Chloroflexota bacterium]